MYVRMDTTDGSVDLSTLRAEAPSALEVKHWRWLEVIENESLSAWERIGNLPTTVAMDATTIAPEVLATPLADWKVRRLATIRQDAHARIVATVPEFKQLNMLARAAELLKKLASDTITQDESDELAGFETVWGSIAAIRTASNAVEEGIESATTQAEVETAYAGVTWPQ